MIEEAIAKIAELQKAACEAAELKDILEVCETPYARMRRVRVAPNEFEVQEEKKPWFGQAHAFRTLDGFVAFALSEQAKLAGPFGEDAGVAGPVFVGDDEVIAFPHYGKSADRLTLKLEPSEEFRGLKAAAVGLGQKAMCLLLATALEGAVDPGLELCLRALGMIRKSEGESRFDLSAGRSAGGQETIQIGVPGQAGPIAVERKWVWTGRLWEGFDHEAHIPLVLEIDPDGEKGPKIVLHPQRLAGVFREERRLLVAEITERLKGTALTVVEGRP